MLRFCLETLPKYDIEEGVRGPSPPPLRDWSWQPWWPRPQLSALSHAITDGEGREEILIQFLFYAAHLYNRHIPSFLLYICLIQLQTEKEQFLFQRWEFIKENKKVRKQKLDQESDQENKKKRKKTRTRPRKWSRKQEKKRKKNKNSTKKVTKKKRKNFLFFLTKFLLSCFLTFLFSFINPTSD